MADGPNNVFQTATPDATRRMSSLANKQTSMLKADYVARLQRQSSPPRCNPYAILILVTSLGLTFIGLTMTLVSHWPGATSAGGENPLRVAGPSLLGLGGAVFMLSIVVIAAVGRMERHQWERNLTTKCSSKNKPVVRSAAETRPHKPLKSCLKTTSSSATLFGSQSVDSINHSRTYCHTTSPISGQDYRDTDRYTGTTRSNTWRHSARRISDSSSYVTDDVDRYHVTPRPTRQTRKRRQRPTRDTGYGSEVSSICSSNLASSSSAGEADIGIRGFGVSPYIRLLPRPSGRGSTRQLAFANLSFENESSAARQVTPTVAVHRFDGADRPRSERKGMQNVGIRAIPSTHIPTSLDPIRIPLVRHGVGISPNHVIVDVIGKVDVIQTGSDSLPSSLQRNSKRSLRTKNWSTCDSLESDI